MNTPATPPDDPMQDFLNVSAALIGVPAAALSTIAGVNTKSYAALAQSANPATFAKMMSVYRAHLSPPPNPDDLAKLLMADADIQPLAQRVMVLWLLGSWNGVVVGVNAYQSGVVWSIARTKPMGTVVGPPPIGLFGNWRNPPPPSLAAAAGKTSS